LLPSLAFVVFANLFGVAFYIIPIEGRVLTDLLLKLSVCFPIVVTNDDFANVI